MGAFVSLFLVVGAVEDFGARPQTASAASGSDFNPGLIISDSNFYNSSAMTEAEIQAFLSAKVGQCRNSNCLADYRQNTVSHTFSFGTCAPYIGGNNESAARIIYKVQVACGLSAKVILVTLQKEQSLVTDPAPSNMQMQKALGQGCPDTADCDATYASFFMQIYSAGRQFTWYNNPNGSFTYIGIGVSRNIAYSPTGSCGSSPVVVRNRATAALYYYTPYQPNAAALGNLYGVGDGCSAYGNRNFWRIYSDWFGTPVGSPYVNLDEVSPTWGGINVRGWARGAGDDSIQYLWVNIDGNGGPIAANKTLNWFGAYFPGYSATHGFQEFITASPGAHEVCLYYPNWVECRYVTVPRGMGSFDSAAGVRGGIEVQGWSVDALATGQSYIWVNVDGEGGAWATNVSLPWLPLVAPGASPDQGFRRTVPALPGSHQVCVYGAEALLGCRTVVVPAGVGSFDSASSVPGGALIQGWFVDFTRTQYSYVWVSVDGAASRPYITNTDLPWLGGYIPGAGTHHGYSLFIPMSKGIHQICVTGEKLHGCKSVTVATQYPAGADVIEAVPSGVRVAGWALDSLNQSEIAYPWITIDGVGRHVRADQFIPWFPALFPEAGSNHGFDSIIPLNPGQHQVCISMDLTLRCQVVNVQ